MTTTKAYTIDGEPAPTCPHCKLVVGSKDKRISPHYTANRKEAPLCPMSGKPDGFLKW